MGIHVYVTSDTLLQVYAYVHVYLHEDRTVVGTLTSSLLVWFVFVTYSFEGCAHWCVILEPLFYIDFPGYTCMMGLP